MIGKMSNINEFSEKLLKKIGAWNVKTNELLRSRKLFMDPNPHSINAVSVLQQYYKNTLGQSQMFGNVR